MAKYHYKNLGGIDRKETSINSSQITFRVLNNYFVSRKGERGALVKRGGSSSYDVTGDLWGISGYAYDTGTEREPTRDTPIRHRRSGATSYIEKLNLSTDAWAAITLGSYTSFATGNIMGTAQIKDLMCICAGRPAKLTDISAGNVNRLGGSAPSAPTAAVGAAGTPAGTYRHVITFKDETSGWESSPSDPTSSTTVSSEQIDLSSIPAVADREGVTHVYIYRTINTDESPFRYVGKVTLGTTTYSDNIADSALGEAAPESSDHDPPPTTSYVCAAFKNRLWIANDNYLYYSQADDGTGVPLEYFSPNRKVQLAHKITALMPNVKGGMYVFTPPGFGIQEVIGRFTDDQDFELVNSYPSEGTYFHPSVKSGGVNNDLIAFWGSGGPRYITPSGITDAGAEQVQDIYENAILSDFGSNIFAWTVWDPLRGRFHMSIVALGDTTGDWENSVSGDAVAWVDSVTSEIVTWS